MNEKGQVLDGFLMLVFLAIVALVILVALTPSAHIAGTGIVDAITDSYPGDVPVKQGHSISNTVYADIPLTKHAENSTHFEWTAAQIQTLFDNGDCTPKNYDCPQDDFKISYCELNAGKSVGLVIGRTVEVIITGFMADTSYWMDRCSATP